jgi:hypothetical protein
LAEETFLTDDFLRQLINVGEVDILVGLPTHNNAKTIGSIVQHDSERHPALVSQRAGGDHQCRRRLARRNSGTGHEYLDR